MPHLCQVINENEISTSRSSRQSTENFVDTALAYSAFLGGGGVSLASESLLLTLMRVLMC